MTFPDVEAPKLNSAVALTRLKRQLAELAISQATEAKAQPAVVPSVTEAAEPVIEVVVVAWATVCVIGAESEARWLPLPV